MDDGKLQTLRFCRWRFGRTVYYNWRNPAGAGSGSFLSENNFWGLDWPSLAAMKNIYEVLRDKEMRLVRVRTEVDALRLVAPLLADR